MTRPAGPPELSIPLFALFTVVTVLLLTASLPRLMGMTLSPLRTVIAALIALFSASPIITVLAGAAVSTKRFNCASGDAGHKAGDTSVGELPQGDELEKLFDHRRLQGTHPMQHSRL